MIDASFVNAITALSGPKTFDVGGKTYADQKLHLVEPEKEKEPVAAPLEINTLDGFVAYATGQLDIDRPSEKQGYFAHIVDYRTVHLVSNLIGYHRLREYLVKAKAEDLFNGTNNFQFNKFVCHSTFMIAAQSLFQQSIAVDQLLRVLGTIKEERVNQSMDDGVSQSVIAKQGIAVVGEVSVPRTVDLQPFRTFREVEQPESSFILRLQAKQGQLPEVALFEADGGRWKDAAIRSIRDYLAAKLPASVSVVA